MNLLVLATGLAVLVIGPQVARGQPATTPCPSGWQFWPPGGYCYLFVNNVTITWEEAYNECSDRQSQLLRVETKDEYDHVKKLQVVFPSSSYWTALNDLPLNQNSMNSMSQTGTFLWGSDAVPLAEVVGNNWDIEPLNTEQNDCVGVDIQGKCSYASCSERHAYICEAPKRRAQDNCPYPWTDTLSGLSCYLTSDASDWSKTVTWSVAKKICEGYKPFGDNRAAHLLAILSTDVQDFLGSYLPSYYYGRQLFWTGLNDIDHEGSPIWAGVMQQSNGRDVPVAYTGTYMQWRREPNNLAGQEHCGVLQPGGKWSDRNCDDKNNYVCRLSPASMLDTSGKGCGAWTRAGHQCVNIYNRPRKTWHDARAFCQAQAGDLYKFYGTDDQLWLTSLAGGKMNMAGYWIGLQRAQKNSHNFVWADGSASNPNALPWDQEPRGYQDYTGDLISCASMGYDGSFLDQKCTGAKSGTVCESNSTTCGSGWLSHAGRCYLIDRRFRTHAEAVDLCAGAATLKSFSKLFALNSADEKNWLVSQLGQWKNGTTFYWSSLRKRSQFGWHWLDPVDDDPVMTQKLVTWNKEPNNWRSNENCVQVSVRGLLNDVDCSHASGFVCQRWVSGFGGASAVAPGNGLLASVVLATAFLSSRWL